MPRRAASGKTIVHSRWISAFAAAVLLALSAVSVLPPAAVAREDTSIGTPGHFVAYGRDYANAGDWAMAETYANLALKLKADHPGALKLLAEAREARAPRAAPPPITAPVAAPEDTSIGTPGYYVKAGREYAAAGDWPLAETYARLGLNLDANHPGARQLLAEARRGKAAAAGAAASKPVAPAAAKPGSRPQTRPQTCDEIYGACYASARRYNPGGPPSVDYAGQQQCMVRRNICYGQRK